ncbi:MAG TPA: glutamate 2,3-aminomutase [Gelria sp.]|jgi:glutamate 2,3-aminomutase|nr:glutamate 2,3-aminomutase [Gelria sp.]
MNAQNTDNLFISLNRADELRSRIQDYLDIEPGMETGFRARERNAQNRSRILEYFDASEEDWNNWVWQVKNRISDVNILSQFLDLKTNEYEEIQMVSKKYRWAISPYYLSLIDFTNYRESPIFKQAVPDIREINDHHGKLDPMGELTTSPVARVTRRYPDRLIINVSNQCAMYCRHCQRRRNIGEKDLHSDKKQLEQALAYIRDNHEIRDVLITGGDALMLSNNRLDWLLGELHKIQHVEIKRLGTRTPVTMPQRITPELCQILKKYPPIYVNTQFNHPLEVTDEAKKACDMLIESGCVLGNQAVLLKSINDDAHIMKKLNQELLKIRVRPYYLFHAKQVKGTAHFVTSVETGLNIMEQLRGYTSGLAVPTYIINAPGGLGKTPILPQYFMAIKDEQITMRTWERKILTYHNKTIEEAT